MTSSSSTPKWSSSGVEVMDATRRGFLGGVCGAALATTASAGGGTGDSTMADPKAILFDVNETLLARACQSPQDP